MLVTGLAPVRAATENQTNRDAILHTLENSAAAWSRNDLQGFMSAYENAPSTTYLKSSGVIRGYNAIQAMYAARFKGPSGSMGQLSLSLVDFRPLGTDYALSIGRFSLVGSSGTGKVARGMFTLVFHHTPGGWKIISDHTSS